jgi:intracellular septation protein
MKVLFDLFPVIFFFATLKGAEKWHGASALLGNIFNFLGFHTSIKPDLAPIMLATLAAIIATILQVTWVKLKHGKVDKMLWLSLGLIVVLGGMTLYFQDATFIKWKPSILYWLFAATLLISNTFFKKNFIQIMMKDVMDAPKSVMDKLNLAWVLFFIFLGCLNWYVAFHYSLDTWASFKLFGTTSIIFLFIIAQTAALKAYLITPPDDKND